jgi:hypothetical protein
MTALELARRALVRLNTQKSACEKSERSEESPRPAIAEVASTEGTGEKSELSEEWLRWGAELRQAVAAIDAARSLPWLSPGQRGLLAAMQAVVEMYHDKRDPLLFGSADWIRSHVARWRDEASQPSQPKRVGFGVVNADGHIDTAALFPE